MHLMFRFRAETSRVWVILREKNKFVKKERKKDKLDISSMIELLHQKRIYRIRLIKDLSG